MKNIRLNTLTPAAKNLLSKFAAMAADESGKVEARFVCTEVLSKRENGTLTSLKNKDLLSSELCEGENGAELHICLSDAALDLIGQMETPVQKLTRKAKKYVAKDVAKAEEAPAAAEEVEEPAPAPVEPAAEEVKEEKPAKPAEPERKRERRVVDTSAVQVNTARFADVDNLVSEREQNYQGGKQRIGGKKGQQQNRKDNKFKGNKARNEEQEKMRRLQMEVARKAPVTVKIGDEITVGELASRMKKTGAEVVKCLMKNGIMAS